jgi:hypothetical protein
MGSDLLINERVSEERTFPRSVAVDFSPTGAATRRMKV